MNTYFYHFKKTSLRGTINLLSNNCATDITNAITSVIPNATVAVYHNYFSFTCPIISNSVKRNLGKKIVRSNPFLNSLKIIKPYSTQLFISF